MLNFDASGEQGSKVQCGNRVRTDPEEGGGVGRGHCRSNREKRRAIHSLSETERKLGGGVADS